MKRFIFVAAAVISVVFVLPSAVFANGNQPHIAVDKSPSNGATAPTAFESQPAVGTKAKCPVMKQEFTVNDKTLFSQYKGKYYAFCCSGCKAKFDADPKKYLE